MTHFQNNVDGWPESIERLPGAWVKFVEGQQRAIEAKQHNPDVKCLIRHWYDPHQVFGGDYDANITRARTFFQSFVDDSFPYDAIDSVSEWNEYYANSQNAEEIADRLMWGLAVNDVWTDEYRSQSGYEHIRLTSCCTAVGNNIPAAHAQIVASHDGLLGYHPYIPVNKDLHPWPGIMEAEWNFYSGRWTVMDSAYRAAGVFVEWIFTEFGAVGHHGGGSLGPLDGWGKDWVCNWNIDQYQGIMAYWFGRWQAWNEQHGHRAHTPQVFTSGGPGSTWDTFEVQQPHLNSIANLFALFPPGEPDPEPPPPPPDPVPYDVLGVDVSHWQGVMDWQTTAAAGAAAFTFIKATDGTAQDDRFWANWPGAKAAGIFRGAYHYYRARVDPQWQVDNFKEALGDDPGELPPVLDCEDQAEPFTVSHLRLTLDLIEAAFGRKPIIYTNFNWWNQHVGVVDWAQDYDLWVANYENPNGPLLPPGWDEWKFWQWTSSGDGAVWGAGSARIDLNYWNGTIDELTAYAAPVADLWNKTVVLLPNATDVETYAKFAAHVHPHDITLSADSAFAPQDLVGTHRVIVYDAETWGGSTALEEWALSRFGVLPVIEYR